MKKVMSIVLFLLLGGLLWYLLLKPSDYTVRFKANTFPGAINQSLKLWDRTLDTVQKITQNGNLYHLNQKVRFGDSIHMYSWQIEPLTDSTSKVRVRIKDEGFLNSIRNKIQVPFSKTDFTSRCEKTVMEYMENLKDHTEKFKVKVIGQAELPSKYLAYIPIEVTQFQKAGGMMRNFSYLTGTLYNKGVQLDGPPMVIVNRWDMEKDSIYYHFAQPIIRSDKLPMGTDIEYRRIFSKPALKAEYNGNYITSDRAWYALLDFAEKNNIEVEPTPVEVFYNNPSTGGDELNWKADVFLPIKENEEL